MIIVNNIVSESDGFTPRKDWYNIREVFKNDYPPAGYEKRGIVLLCDSVFSDDLSLFGGTYYRTSDGYTGIAYNHTWNLTFDKPCELGYKTRYVIIYTENGSLDISLGSYNLITSVLWTYFDICNITSIFFRTSSTTLPAIFLEAFECSDNTTATSNALQASAFRDNTNLKKVDIPPGITVIPNSCFALTGLTKIFIPDGVLNIGIESFYSCQQLKEVRLPDGLLSGGNNVFQNCTSLKTIVIPNSITSIFNWFRTTGLTSIVIPDSVTNISGAFYLCRTISAIKIPASVTSYDNSALSYIFGLISIEVEQNYILPANLSLAFCWSLSQSSIKKLSESLGQTPVPLTITFNAGVKALIPEDVIDMFSYKGYSIA